MKYRIKLDYREKKLIELYNENENENLIEINNLDIGDIIIYNNDENKVQLVIERKTISDLCSSIIDGRYREQKERLISNFLPEQILYILEGEYKSYKNPIDYKTVLGTIINCNLRDNIKIIQTKNINDTYDYINLIINKLNSNKLVLYNNNKDDNDKKDNNNIENLIKLKKKDNLTPELYFITILAQIPGCSINIAKKIQEQIKTLLELQELYNNKDINKLENIMIGKRKLGNKLAKKIILYLFNKII